MSEFAIRLTTPARIALSASWQISRMNDLAGQYARNYRWRCRGKMIRLKRVVRYFLHRTTKEDANQFLYEMQDIAGIYALETFDVEGLMEEALERWEPHPDLLELAEDAASRVAHKWAGDDGHLANAAEDWALDLIQQYAADRGIELSEVDGAEEYGEEEEVE